MPSYIITGANRGLGFEFVRQLSSDKSNTVIATTRRPSPELSSLQEKHPNLHPLTLDVSDVESVRRSLRSEVAKILGSEDAQLNFLLNSAGMNSHNDQGVMEIDPALLVHHVQVNVQSAAETVKALEPLLKNGSVVMNVRISNLPRHCSRGLCCYRNPSIHRAISADGANAYR